MKLFRITLCCLVFSVVFSKVNAQYTYLLDVKQSKLFWKGTKTVGSKHLGYLLFNAGIIYTNASGMFTEGRFSLDMRSITTTDKASVESNRRVDRELKGSSFFGVTSFPQAVMVVKRIMPAVKPGTYTVQGNLTIKEITHPISFLASLTPNGNRLTATAQFSIDRVKWGIHETKPVSISDQIFSTVKDKLIADEIPVRLQLQFNRHKN